MQEDSRLRYIKNKKNLGYSGNCNALIKEAKGKYIAIYHSDDIYGERIVEKEVEFLEENKELAGVFTKSKTIDENGQTRKFASIFKIKKDTIIDLELFIETYAKRGNIIPCPSAMIKKSVYNEIGDYDVSLPYIPDVDMWLRILKFYKLGLIAENLYSTRRHTGQNSNILRDLKRKEKGRGVKRIQKFIEEDEQLNEKYSKYINIMYSRDLTARIANSITIGKKREEIREDCLKSREYYTFPMFRKERLLQNADNFFVYQVLKLIIPIYIKRYRFDRALSLEEK
jgi:glycosyltransferase involved in cell wall biosynthesis